MQSWANHFPLLLKIPIIKTHCGKSSRNHPCPSELGGGFRGSKYPWSTEKARAKARARAGASSKSRSKSQGRSKGTTPQKVAVAIKTNLITKNFPSFDWAVGGRGGPPFNIRGKRLQVARCFLPKTKQEKAYTRNPSKYPKPQKKPNKLTSFKNCRIRTYARNALNADGIGF